MSYVDIEETVTLRIDPFEYINAYDVVNHFSIRTLMQEAGADDVADAIIADYSDYVQEVVDEGCESGLADLLERIAAKHEGLIGEWIDSEESTDWATRISIDHHVESVRAELTEDEVQELIDKLIKMKQEEYGN